MKWDQVGQVEHGISTPLIVIFILIKIAVYSIDVVGGRIEWPCHIWLVERMKIASLEASLGGALGPWGLLTLKAPITTKFVCFSRLLKCLRSLFGKQCGPRSDCSLGAVCSGSTLFASTLISSVVLGNYLQQTTSADDIFRCIFFLAL